MKKEPKAISVKNEIVATSAEQLISQAINKGVTPENMEKLLSMRRELKKEWAKEQYDLAMADFQSACPVIKKTKIVKNKDGSVRYKFAPIDSIVLQIGSLLKKNGFSYSIDSRTVDNGLTIYCKVTHQAGHSEVSEFTVPIDKGAFMNEAQKVASASTFAKRYAFCNAFGILTGDEDDDSVASGEMYRNGETTQPGSFSEAKGDSKVWVKDPNAPASDKQIWMINKLLEETQLSNDWLEKKAGRLGDMKKGVASQVIEQLQKKKEKMGEQVKEDIPTIDAETGEVIK
jgi:hypothetical protein